MHPLVLGVVLITPARRAATARAAIADSIVRNRLPRRVFMHTYALMFGIDSYFIDRGLSKAPTLAAPLPLLTRLLGGGGGGSRLPTLASCSPFLRVFSLLVSFVVVVEIP